MPEPVPPEMTNITISTQAFRKIQRLCNGAELYELIDSDGYTANGWRPTGPTGGIDRNDRIHTGASGTT